MHRDVDPGLVRPAAAGATSAAADVFYLKRVNLKQHRYILTYRMFVRVCTAQCNAYGDRCRWGYNLRFARGGPVPTGVASVILARGEVCEGTRFKAWAKAPI